MADDQSFFNNRGQLEESLYATAKLLETLDKNNRMEEASEVNFLLAGMEGLIGQFSENQFDMQHEIQEMLESSRQGLLTHEKLVEMIMAEQVRSQYLNSIVGSLRDQIENLFNTIVNKEDDNDESSSQDFIDKVSSNVSLMWKQVDSLSKVISSPTKKLDQTIRKIDSEVVVHLNKSSMHSQDKRENFAEKIDKQLEKVKTKTPTTAAKLKTVEESATSKSYDQDDGNGTFQTGVPNINRKVPPKPKKKTAEDYMNDLESELDGGSDKHVAGGDDHTPLTSARLATSTSHDEHNNCNTTIDNNNKHVAAEENENASLDELSLDDLIAHDDDDNDHDLDHTSHVTHSGKHKKKKGGTGANKGTSKASSTSSNSKGNKANKNGGDDHHGAGGNRRRSFDKPGNAMTAISAVDSRDEYDQPASATAAGGGGLTIGSRATAAANAAGSGGTGGGGNSSSIYNTREQSPVISASLTPIKANANSTTAGGAASANLLAASRLLNSNNTNNRPTSHTEAERQSTLEGESPTHRRRSLTTNNNNAANELPQLHIVDDEISLGSKKPSHQSQAQAAQQQADAGWPQERDAFIKVMQAKEQDLQVKHDDIDRIVREKLLQAMKLNTVTNIDTVRKTASTDKDPLASSSKSPNINDLQAKLQLLLQETDAKESNQVSKGVLASNTSSAIIMSDDTPTSRTADSSHHNLRSTLNSLPSVMSEGVINGNEFNYDQDDQDDESAQSQHDHAIRALSRSLQLSGSTNLDPQQIIMFLSQQVKALERGDVTFKGDTGDYQQVDASGKVSRIHNAKSAGDTANSPSNKGGSSKRVSSNPLDTIKRRLASHVDEDQHAEQIDDLLQTILFNASKSGGKAPDWERIKIGLPTKKATTTEMAINTDQSMNNMLGNPMMQYHAPQHHGVGVTGVFPAHHGTVLPMTVSPGGGFAYAAAAAAAASPGGTTGGMMMTTEQMNIALNQQPDHPQHQLALQMMSSSPMQAHLPPLASNKGSLLPIYDNQQDLLITRTYRPPPEKEHFMHLLQNAPDPLLFIYKECKSMLSKEAQAKLLRLSAPSDSNDHSKTQDEELSKQRWLTVAALLWEQVQILEEEIQGMTIIISDLETISQDAIMIVKAARKGGKINATAIRNSFTITDHNVNLMESHLFDVNRLMGELEARLLAANLQQLEHRSLFQSLQAKGIKELPSLCRSIPDLKKSFDSAQSNQGLLYEIQQRLLLCRDRCKRYDLFKYLPYHGEGGGGSMMSANESFSRHPSASFLPALTVEPPRPGSSNHTRINKPYQSAMISSDMEAVLFDQQEQIKQLTEEIEDLEMELLEVVKERDHTPDAILFYSLLHDPAYVSNLQQLCLQLKNVRGFLDYSVHMDYQTLRKRLSVCMVLIPNVEKLIESYGLQYKQWSKFRQNWFAERNLRGGTAEGLATCPLCYKSLLEEEEKPIDHDHGSADHKRKAVKPRKKHGHAHTLAATVSALDPDLFGSANNNSSKGKSEQRMSSSLKFPPPQKQQQGQQTRQQKIEDIPQINLAASIKAIRDRS